MSGMCQENAGTPSDRSSRRTARFEQPKVLVKDTSADFACTYDPDSFYVKDVLIVIPKPDVAKTCDLRSLPASSTPKRSVSIRTTFQTLHVQNEELASLPIPRINLEDPPDKRGTTDGCTGRADAGGQKATGRGAERQEQGFYTTAATGSTPD